MKLLAMPDRYRKKLVERGVDLAPACKHMLLVSPEKWSYLKKAAYSAFDTTCNYLNNIMLHHHFRSDLVMDKKGKVWRVEVNVGSNVGIWKADAITKTAYGFVSRNLEREFGGSGSRSYLHNHIIFAKACHIIVDTSKHERIKFCEEAGIDIIYGLEGIEEMLFGLDEDGYFCEYRGKQYRYILIEELWASPTNDTGWNSMVKSWQVFPNLYQKQFTSEAKLDFHYKDRFNLRQMVFNVNNPEEMREFWDELGVYRIDIVPRECNFVIKVPGSEMGKNVIADFDHSFQKLEEVNALIERAKWNMNEPVIILQNKVDTLMINGLYNVFKLFPNGSGLVYLANKASICGSKELTDKENEYEASIVPIVVSNEEQMNRYSNMFEVAWEMKD